MPAGVGELVQHRDGVAEVGHALAHEGRADEAGAAADEEPHAARPRAGEVGGEALLPGGSRGHVVALGAQDGVRRARRGAAELGGGGAVDDAVGAGGLEGGDGEVVPRALAAAGDVDGCRSACGRRSPRARPRGGRRRWGSRPGRRRRRPRRARRRGAAWCRRSSCRAGRTATRCGRSRSRAWRPPRPPARRRAWSARRRPAATWGCSRRTARWPSRRRSSRSRAGSTSALAAAAAAATLPAPSALTRAASSSWASAPSTSVHAAQLTTASGFSVHDGRAGGGGVGDVDLREVPVRPAHGRLRPRRRGPLARASPRRR